LKAAWPDIGGVLSSKWKILSIAVIGALVSTSITATQLKTDRATVPLELSVREFQVSLDGIPLVYVPEKYRFRLPHLQEGQL
jgi:hypothetical protein